MLRCTGRAYPHRPIRARPGRPAGARSGTSRTRRTPIPSITSTSRVRSPPARASASTLIWIFPEVGGAIPADPTLPIPSNAHWMPLASLVQVPFLAVLGTDRVGLGAAVRAHRRGRGADDLGDGPRRRGSEPGRRRRRRSSSPSRCCRSCTWSQPDNFSLFQPLVGRGAVDGRARPQGIAEVVRGRQVSWRGSRHCHATTGCWSSPRSGIAFLWDRWRRRRRSRGRPRSACVGLFVLVMAPWWLRQLAVFGSISPSTASGKVFFIRDIAEWNSISIPATLDHLLGMGIGPSHRQPDRRARGGGR